MTKRSSPFPYVGALVGLAMAVGLALIVAVGPGLGVPEPPPETLVADAADRWLDAWERNEFSALVEMSESDDPDLIAAYERFAANLGVIALDLAARPPVVDGDRARVGFEAEVELAELGTWAYVGRLDLVRTDDSEVIDEAWRVTWRPSSIHPALDGGGELRRSESFGPSGELLGVEGTPLTGETAPDLPALRAQLLGSLQATFDDVLAGQPSGQVEVVESGEVREVLATFAGTPGRSVRTTIDPDIQAAAEAALSGSRPAALVALNISTGEVRASVSRPTIGFNRALVGRYPPGSTFKVVTTAALLGTGTTPTTAVDCPAEASVGGRAFANAGDRALGEIDFATAFAESCNTAFVRLAETLDPSTLVAVAADFGFGTSPDLGVDVEASSFPEPTGLVDRAAASIGQGRVLATPLQMASVAATVAGGAYNAPRLVLEGPIPAAIPLDSAVTTVLSDLMARAVADGTGQAAFLPGGVVHGKTGSAEFGRGDPLPSHAWFIGFRGDLAVAVIVEDGGAGGAVAAPLAADFFARAAGA